VTEPEGNPAGLRERIRQAFGNFPETGDRPYRLAASIGLVQAWPGAKDSLDALLASADALMYQDKLSKPGRRGRKDDR
jgi:GGDEF domain-containing protein